MGIGNSMRTIISRNDRRKSRRVNTPDAVSNCRLFSSENDGTCQFRVWPIKNLSAEGTAIKSEEQVASGALAFLNVDLDVLMKTVGVISKVIWCQKRGQGYEIGLNFCKWPKAEEQKLMLDFMKNKITRQEQQEEQL